MKLERLVHLLSNALEECEETETGRVVLADGVTLADVQVLQVELDILRRAPRCAWSSDDDGVWTAACGFTFAFDGGDGPIAHGFNTCPCCGRPLTGVAGDPSRG